MDKKTTGIVSYITLIGWLIAYLAGDKEGAKFHLNQSLIVWLLWIICSVVSRIPLVGIIGSIGGIAVFIFWILGIVAAIQDQEKELPLVGGIRLL